LRLEREGGGNDSNERFIHPEFEFWKGELLSRYITWVFVAGLIPFSWSPFGLAVVSERVQSVSTRAEGLK
jgi:hypothetical protein